MRAFPPLPAPITSILDVEHLRLEQLAARPQEWPTLSEQDLMSLLKHASIVSAIAADERRRGPLYDLYAVALAGTTEEARMAVFEEVTEQVEHLQRGGAALADAFAIVPFIEYDPSSVVVSSATLAAAVLMGGKHGDADEGRATVLRFAQACQEPDRQCAMIQGLLALGDPDVVDALRGCWRPMSVGLRDELDHAASQLPMSTTVEFLLCWAEDALWQDRDEVEMCRPLGALSMLARRARGAVPGGYGGRGIYRLVRNYPAAAHPPEGVAQIAESWGVSEFGIRIEPRLRALASAETEKPRIADSCLAEWGRGGA